MEPVDENVSDDENKTTTAENESDEENGSTIVENHFINKYALVDGNINEWVLAVEEVEAEEEDPGSIATATASSADDDAEGAKIAEEGVEEDAMVEDAKVTVEEVEEDAEAIFYCI